MSRAILRLSPVLGSGRPEGPGLRAQEKRPMPSSRIAE